MCQARFRERGFSSAPWSSNTSHSLEHETDEESEKCEVTKSSPDAGENPYARVNGLITDLIQTKADSQSTLTS